jgi:hypothetical protein
MKGFIIRQPWCDYILEGLKTWELRGSRCHKRGTVGLVCMGQFVGTIDIIDCVEISLEDYLQNRDKHQVKEKTTLPYKKTYAWVLANPKRFIVPKKYNHKKGCVIWVNLD